MRTAVTKRVAFPLGKVADEGSPLTAGLTAACTLVIPCSAAEPPSPHQSRLSRLDERVRPTPHYQNHNLGWHEVPQAVEHPRDTEKPPGTPSGRRLRLETIQSPVERLFPLFKGESHAGA